jgi:hypothetical protein
MRGGGGTGESCPLHPHTLAPTHPTHIHPPSFRRSSATRLPGRRGPQWLETASPRQQPQRRYAGFAAPCKHTRMHDDGCNHCPPRSTTGQLGCSPTTTAHLSVIFIVAGTGEGGYVAKGSQAAAVGEAVQVMAHLNGLTRHGQTRRRHTHLSQSCVGIREHMLANPPPFLLPCPPGSTTAITREPRTDPTAGATATRGGTEDRDS